MELTPELRLLAICANRRPGAAAVDAFHSWAPSVHWPLLLALAARHRMLIRLHAFLSQNRVDVPSSVHEALEPLAQRNAARNMLLTAEMFRVSELIRAASARAIAFKGPTLALMVEGDTAQRVIGDLDILVDWKDLGKITDALAAASYTLLGGTPNWNNYHAAFCDTRRNLIVELHWRFSLGVLYPPLILARDVDQSVEYCHNGRTIQVLDPLTNLLMLAIHGFKHQWARIGWLADIVHSLQSADDVQLKALMKRAEDRGAARIVRVAIRLACDVTMTDVPACMAPWLKDGAAEELVRQFIDHYTLEAKAAAILVRDISFDSALDVQKLLDQTVSIDPETQKAGIAIETRERAASRRNRFANAFERRRDRARLWAAFELHDLINAARRTTSEHA